jgi:hypothetical protein
LSATVSTTPGIATVRVRAVVGKHQSKAAAYSVQLPDVSAPQGSYSSTWSDTTGQATITQESLSDNSPVLEVQRTVDWNDGSPPETWSPGSSTTINHTYPLTEKRYRPTVTLQDAAHNTRVVDVPAIVINDDEAPTGTFSVTPGTGWAGFTVVTVFQEGSLVDNWTPASKITRSVEWGDGAIMDWPFGHPLTHVYATAGSYTPVVTITDEARNSTPVSTSEVVVTADATRPQVKLVLPRAKHSVKAWRTLRGKATDTGTGVKSVRLKAVEKRGGTWFGYNAVKGSWVKAGDRAKAFTRSKASTLTTNARHRWAAKLIKLRKGTLVYKVRAADQVHNRSVTMTHKTTLTRT